MSISQNTQQEHLGYIFVRAVAYAAGFSCYRPEVDDDSIDLGIAKRGAGGIDAAPRVWKCKSSAPARAHSKKHNWATNCL